MRDSEWEISEIIRTRTNQEQNITLETPYYDIVRIKVGGAACRSAGAGAGEVACQEEEGTIHVVGSSSGLPSDNTHVSAFGRMVAMISYLFFCCLILNQVREVV